jgi:hypothetical protein
MEFLSLSLRGKQIKAIVFRLRFNILLCFLQSQVNDGIPVGTCLMLFNNWLRELIKTKNIKFLSDVLKPTEAEQNSKIDVKWCTFVTWSGTLCKENIYINFNSLELLFTLIHKAKHVKLF